MKRSILKVSLEFVVPMVLLSACAGKPAEVATYNEREEKAKIEFEKGLKYLDQEKYPEAIKVFKKILVQSPALEFDFVILYNLGAGYEGLKNCGAAADSYRQVARGSSGKFQRLEALALLRLSYTYECLGQDNKALVALLDVRRRSAALPEDTAKAEVPARLAAAYARSGNRPEAEKYFRLALDGIKALQVKYKESVQMADRLAETLYFMGRSSVSEDEFKKNPVPQIRGLQLMQLYLLQAAELGSSKWSGRATDEILGTYEKLWLLSQTLGTPESGDAQAEKQKSSELRADVLKETLRSVRVLKAQRLPNRSESSEMKRLFNGAVERERQLISVLAEVEPANPRTPEAERRQGIKAEGRVKNSSETALERQARERKQLPKKATKTSP